MKTVVMHGTGADDKWLQVKTKLGVINVFVGVWSSSTVQDIELVEIVPYDGTRLEVAGIGRIRLKGQHNEDRLGLVSLCQRRSLDDGC